MNTPILASTLATLILACQTSESPDTTIDVPASVATQFSPSRAPGYDNKTSPEQDWQWAVVTFNYVQRNPGVEQRVVFDDVGRAIGHLVFSDSTLERLSRSTNVLHTDQYRARMQEVGGDMTFIEYRAEPLDVRQLNHETVFFKY